MHTKIELPKAFSVRDEHEFLPIQHLLARRLLEGWFCASNLELNSLFRRGICKGLFWSN